MFWVGLILGCIIGGFWGSIIFAAIVIARMKDNEMEKYFA